MDYNANTDSSDEKRNEFIQQLTEHTVAALTKAQGDHNALHAAVKEYVSKASNANLDIEDIENILGINEPCIMDLAALSETDEEIVIDVFEQLIQS